MHRLTEAGARVVPLALHVDYWDSIGWKDRFAQPAFTERQRWEVRANRHRTAYTPHFFVNGKEVLDWRADLADELRASSAPASARVDVDAVRQGANRWHVRVAGTIFPGTTHGPLQLFVVLTESGLASQVDAGENRGSRLEHDAVAREWIGPLAITGGAVNLDRIIDVAPSNDHQLGVVAFIQDATTAEVVQAVGTGVCQPG